MFRLTKAMKKLFKFNKKKCIKPTLTALPDLCLLKIMDNLPIQDLFRVRQVASRFAHLYPAACIRRQSLSLLVGKHIDCLINHSYLTISHLSEIQNFRSGTRAYPSQYTLQFSRLAFPQLTPEIVLYLTHLLPNVKHLELAIQIDCNCNPKDTDCVLQLFNAYAPQLVSLKFWCQYWEDFMQHCATRKRIATHMNEILKVVNYGMPKLRILFMDSCDRFVNEESMTANKRLNFPVLSQLNEFCFNSPDTFGQIMETLKEYGEPSATIQKLAIGNDLCRPITSEKRRKVLQYFDPNFLAKFTNLYNIVDLDQLRDNYLNHCANPMSPNIFESLTTVKIPPISMHFNKIAEFMYPLKNLVSLDLDFNRNNCFNVFELSNSSIRYSRIPQLNSVRLLTIRFCASSHCDMQSPFWARVFPKIQIISFVPYDFYCKTCQEDEHYLVDYYSTPKERQQLCIIRLVMPWIHEQCLIGRRTLKTVFTTNFGSNQLKLDVDALMTYPEMSKIFDEEEERARRRAKYLCR